MWKILCNGSHYGEYTKEEYANAAWAMATSPRPKNKYTFQLLQDGRVIKERTSQLTSEVKR